MMGYWTACDRIILIKLKAKPFDIALIQVYAPTTDYSDEDVRVEIFYEQLQGTIKQCKSTDIVILLGDWNAKIGAGRYKTNVRQYSLGTRNERGDRLVEFHEGNQFLVCNTFYQRSKRHLYTWKSPGDIRRNQIDFILIRERFKNYIKCVKTYPGADIDSDHNPGSC